MAKRTRKRQFGYTLPYTDKAFLPYVIALGQLALAWNGLHETLAFLFCSIMGGGYANQFLAVWHAIKSDRAQREILLAATKNHLEAGWPHTFVEDVEWLCGRIDSLEDARNDALHSPLSAYPEVPTSVRPVTGLGHIRAKKLSTKHLLSEFRWCRDSAVVLAKFAYEMDAFLSDYKTPWPNRPQLPNRGDGRGAKYPPRPKPRTPPRSSQE
jgi:hypothetical protein